MTVEETSLFLKALGSRIRQLRKSKNIRLRDIMISTGYYDAQWRKYEAGGGLTVQSLLRIAVALDVSLSTLLNGLGNWPMLSVAEIEQAYRPEGTPLRRSTDLAPNKQDVAPSTTPTAEVKAPPGGGGGKKKRPSEN